MITFSAADYSACFDESLNRFLAAYTSQ